MGVLLQRNLLELLRAVAHALVLLAALLILHFLAN